MRKRRLRNSNRPKAIFGFVEAAGSIAAAGIQAMATANAARQQAEAQLNAARMQADALNQQNENANKLQEQRISFDKRENELERDILKNQQLNEQIQAGQLNRNERLNAGRIAYKNGGLKYGASSLRGIYSKTPFTVTDGGNVIPLGVTPTGEELYEIVGNDHNHYHKTKGGKYKSGVGIRFANGGVVEGEGNQNSRIGELLLVGNGDAKFISKHSIKGFNPTKAVLNGMNPNYAFAIQENIKDMNNINDDGSTTPVEKRRKTASCGKRLRYAGRARADFGTWYDNLNPNQQNLFNTGVTGAVNTTAWGLTALGNRYATNQQVAANNAASDIMVDAYNRMKGIDPNIINRNNYRASHAMAALQAPIVDNGYERAAAERALQRSITTAREGSLSSAAAQNKINTLHTNYADVLSNIEGEAAKRRNAIIQENMSRLTDVSKTNAALDAQASKDYNDAALRIAEYNNDIENSKLEGIAQARANSLIQNAQLRGQNRLATMTGLANAINATGRQYGTGVENIRKTNAEKEMAMFGSSPETLIALYSQNPRANFNKLMSLYNQYSNPTNDYDKNIFKRLQSILHLEA